MNSASKSNPLNANGTQNESPSAQPATESKWLFPAIALTWIAIAAFGAHRFQGPSAKATDVPETEFSAGRTLEILEAVVGDGIPHESGSEQNKIVRERIIQQFEKLGYQVETQESTAIRLPEGEPVELVNLMIRLKGKNHGTDQQRTIIALSHYDSKPGAGGAADDGVAVACSIEIARMLKGSEPLNHDVLFVITDGEEFGLLGAKAFVAEHEYAKECDVVINLEARGTSGPSLMFETNDDNARLIPIFDRAVHRPMCSSLFFEIYKRLPNDTDFTEFRKAGYAGYNFAFIGNVKYYHTPEDRIQNVNHRSVQHHGDNLLGLIRGLDKTDQFRPTDSEADFFVYFDLFGFKIFYWPAFWSWLILLAAIPGFLFAGWRLARRVEPTSSSEMRSEDVAKREVLFAIARVFDFGYLALFVFIMWLGVCALHMGLWSAEMFSGFGWINAALACELSYWFIAIGAAFIFAWLFEQRERAKSLFLMILASWFVVSVPTIIFLVGGSYLFVVPLLISSLLAIPIAMFGRSRRFEWLLFVFAVSVGLFWLPLERMFYDGVGFQMQAILIGRVLLVTSTLIPVIMLTAKRFIPIYGCLFAFLGFACSVFAVVAN